ncbi:hypothetical protein [Curtobacterium sp. Arg-1]|uniref:hypothetical protein n=1 Tax=Curtobacterium sp. Arg-1 TaxID=2935040 RepID=UPI0021D840C9|nr:hypothetical protein [Curtobacterium sp. Arg-1]UXZ57097.1 hypothetical protein MXD64_13965 [Curtobacterium sp. Arg-1]
MNDDDLRTWIVDFRTILFAHQRNDGRSCMCGFDTTFHAHSDHQADMLQERLAKIEEAADG